MAKIIKGLIFNIQLGFLLVALTGVFACRMTEVKKTIEPTKNNPYDPLCGDSVVIWHIHLQEGFDFDTIQFVVNTDTFPDYSIPSHPHPWIVAKSGYNGCTSIRFSCYRYEGETKIFIANMPYFNEIGTIDEVDPNNISIQFIVNGEVFQFNTSLVYNRFFGFNYNAKGKNFSVWKGKSCFYCL